MTVVLERPPRTTVAATVTVPVALLVLLLRLIADQRHAVLAARRNCENEQADHSAYRAAHGGRAPRTVTVPGGGRL